MENAGLSLLLRASVIPLALRRPSEGAMYHLTVFNVDAGGRPIDIVKMGAAYSSAPGALADAARLRLGTHFRIKTDGGRVVLEDSLPALGEVVAA
jgi:hypothetical protein